MERLPGLCRLPTRSGRKAGEVIQRLHATGHHATRVMLTGDNAVVARAVGRRLGLTRQFADMLPADKAEVIQQFQRDGNVVAMVGDGINDSPALSFADVGIAMKHGAEVARESADVVLMEDSLWKLVKAVEISRGAVRLIHQNYAIVAGLNTLALGLALPGGLIIPEITALISNGSAILASLERNSSDPAISMIRRAHDHAAAHAVASRPRSASPRRSQSGKSGLCRSACRLCRQADRAGDAADAESRKPRLQQDRRNAPSCNCLNVAINSIEPQSKAPPAQRAASRAGRHSAAGSAASSGSPRCRSSCR